MISIIIIVKNDLGIEQTLNKIIKINIKQVIETIVVDASKGKLDHIKNKFSTVLWISFLSKSHKLITIPEQRNTGIKHAKGNIVVFTDANCEPNEHWLNNLTEPILNDDEFVVSGKTVSSKKKTIHDTTSMLNSKKKYL